MKTSHARLCTTGTRTWYSRRELNPRYLIENQDSLPLEDRSISLGMKGTRVSTLVGIQIHQSFTSPGTRFFLGYPVFKWEIPLHRDLLRCPPFVPMLRQPKKLGAAYGIRTHVLFRDREASTPNWTETAQIKKFALSRSPVIPPLERLHALIPKGMRGQMFPCQESRGTHASF